MLSTVRVALVAGLLSAIPNSFAQTGPIVPGAELLPASIRHYAETPLVLTPAAAPTFCMDMSGSDPHGKTVHLWRCWPGWNQKIWFDTQTSAGDRDHVRIRIGKLACLQSSLRGGGRASMGICGDAPAAESWNMRDGRLADASGLCLAPTGPANGAALVTEACVPGSEQQQWRIEAMRTALNRNPGDWKDPSGLGKYHYMGYLPDVVEEFRPRFTPRALTPAERSEIRALMAPWSKYKALDFLTGTKGDAAPPPLTIPWKTLRRLSELGETGDKDAMRAVLEAFALLRYSNGRYLDQGLRGAGWEPTAFPNAEKGEFAYKVAGALADLWGAHYWQKHGPDRLAGTAFLNCHLPAAFVCIGYKARLSYPKPTGNLDTWVREGDAKYATLVNEIAFMPAEGSFEERESRFVGYLDHTYTYRTGPNVFDEFRLATQAVHAEKSGRLALWDNMRLNESFEEWSFTSSQELAMRQTLKARADAADWKARFDAFMAAPAPLPYELGKMQAELVNRSDADLFRYAEKHEVWFAELEPRLCAPGREAGQPCVAYRHSVETRRRNYEAEIARARAEEEALRPQREREALERAAKEGEERARLASTNPPREPDFWDQLADLAEGFAAAAEAGNQQVTVRKYDSAGNFLGTETMTRSRAMGLGAQTSN